MDPNIRRRRDVQMYAYLLLAIVFLVVVGTFVWYFWLKGNNSKPKIPRPQDEEEDTEPPLTSQQKLNLLIKDYNGKYFRLHKSSNNSSTNECLAPGKPNDYDENVKNGDNVIFANKCNHNSAYWTPINHGYFYSLANMRNSNMCLDYDKSDLEVRSCDPNNTNQHFKFVAMGNELNPKLKTINNTCIVADPENQTEHSCLSNVSTRFTLGT